MTIQQSHDDKSTLTNVQVGIMTACAASSLHTYEIIQLGSSNGTGLYLQTYSFHAHSQLEYLTV